MTLIRQKQLENIDRLSTAELYQLTHVICEEELLDLTPAILQELENRTQTLEKDVADCYEEINEALEMQLGILLSISAEKVELDEVYALREEARIRRAVPSANLLPFLSQENRRRINDIRELAKCLALIKVKTIENHLVMIAKHAIDLSHLRPETSEGNNLIISATNIILNIALNSDTDERKLDKLSLLTLEINKRLEPLLDQVKKKLNPVIPAHQNILFEIDELFKILPPPPITVKRLRFEEDAQEPLSQFYINANPQRFKHLKDNANHRIAKKIEF